jgi:hypothetical protein
MGQNAEWTQLILSMKSTRRVIFRAQIDLGNPPDHLYDRARDDSGDDGEEHL